MCIVKFIIHVRLLHVCLPEARLTNGCHGCRRDYIEATHNKLQVINGRAPVRTIYSSVACCLSIKPKLIAKVLIERKSHAPPQRTHDRLS